MFSQSFIENVDRKFPGMATTIYLRSKKYESLFQTTFLWSLTFRDDEGRELLCYRNSKGRRKYDTTAADALVYNIGRLEEDLEKHRKHRRG